jgi:hypothetical protein
LGVVKHGACPPDLGVVGPIASASSSKPLTAKPDAVNGFGLAGKVAVKCVEAELLYTLPNSPELVTARSRVRAQRLLNSSQPGRGSAACYYTKDFLLPRHHSSGST